MTPLYHLFGFQGGVFHSNGRRTATLTEDLRQRPQPRATHGRGFRIRAAPSPKKFREHYISSARSEYVFLGIHLERLRPDRGPSRLMRPFDHSIPDILMDDAPLRWYNSLRSEVVVECEFLIFLYSRSSWGLNNCVPP